MKRTRSIGGLKWIPTPPSSFVPREWASHLLLDALAARTELEVFVSRQVTQVVSALIAE
jgi:hypothetical protein